MHSLRLGLAASICSILLGACFLTVETFAASTASFGVADNKVGDRSSAEVQDKADFLILVKDTEVKTEGITHMENTSVCPYRALTFNGLTHVVCDFRRCDSAALCKDHCRQAIAYVKSKNHITKEEPKGNYSKVYIGCVYRSKDGIESTAPPPPVS